MGITPVHVQNRIGGPVSDKLCSNTLDGEAVDVGTRARMLEGDSADIPLSVNVKDRVLVEVSALGDVVRSELDVERVGVFEVADFHGLNLRSKNALWTVSPSDERQASGN